MKIKQFLYLNEAPVMSHTQPWSGGKEGGEAHRLRNGYVSVIISVYRLKSMY